MPELKAKGLRWYVILDEKSRGVYCEWDFVLEADPAVFRGFDSENQACEWLSAEVERRKQPKGPTTRSKKTSGRFAWYTRSRIHISPLGGGRGGTRTTIKHAY